MKLLILFIALVSQSYAATSVTSHGVTWVFNGNYTTGTYCNGDPWVVGPVTITSITPIPTDGQNGAMVNPGIGTDQGYTAVVPTQGVDYNSALNVAKTMPFTVAVNKSLVSSITSPTYTRYDSILQFAVLTVVQSPPAAGAFRPPAVGTIKTIPSTWNKDNLNYSKLNVFDRAVLPATPDIKAYAGYFANPWIETNPNWTGGGIRPSYMGPNGYGRFIADRTGDAAILLQLNYSQAEKEALLIGVVQAAIDNYGFIQAGGVWYNDGGWNVGRLSPLIIAAGVLDDNAMKSVITGAQSKFQEFQTTFMVTQADTTRTLGQYQWVDVNGVRTWGLYGTNGDPIHPYTMADVGKAEWGVRHTGSPELDNNWWDAAYRSIVGSTLTAPTMVAKVMGLRGVINHEPLFLYAERHLDYELSPTYQNEFWTNPTRPFPRQFYSVYKNAAPGSGTGGTGGTVAPPVVVASFAVGDRISVWRNTNVRATGTLSGTLLGTQSTDLTGTIVEGPIVADNITWWQVDYDTGVDGWSGQDNFVKLTAQAPSKTEGLRVVIK